ncbi:Spherulation-specific family 4-domain-containing protein [Xylariales sp. AK1849]|nr:Spherulation-specific family 4-domain-containing protein [Xylariales sp. AK1849]
MKLSVISGLSATAAATDLLLPLYNAPGTSGSAWAPVQSALAAHPDLQANIVINVNSGPGNPFSTSEGADWVAGGQALGGLPNVALLGYVPVDRTNRALADAEADAATWASWISEQGVPISGIFVDEAPNSDCDTCVTYMQELTTYVRETAALPVVVYNPGFPATVHALGKYYALGPNYVAALETCFAEASNGDDLCTPAGSYEIYDHNGYGTTIDSTLLDWVGTEYYGKMAVLIHGFHDTNGLYNATDDVLSNELLAIVERGIGAAVFTTNHWITPDKLPADIGTVAGLLDAANKA